MPRINYSLSTHFNGEYNTANGIENRSKNRYSTVKILGLLFNILSEPFVEANADDDDVKKPRNIATFGILTVTFEHRHENKSCSAC